MKKKLLLTIIVLLIKAGYCVISAQEVIAQWSKYNSNLRETDVYASAGNENNKEMASLQRISNGTPTIIIANKEGTLYTDNWHDAHLEEKYWMATFSSMGCNNLTITTKQQSSATGPRNFKVQYKIGNSAWIDLGITTIKTAGVLTTTLNNVSLPAEMENNPKVSLRWLVADNTAVNNSSMTNSGTSYIDIAIHGVFQETPPPTVWSPKNASTDWNDKNNWSNGIPDTFSNIEIHSESTSYPSLKAGDQAICDTIFFRTSTHDQSGLILNSHLLQYNSAVVELLPSANQYHLIAPPLGGIYSGDFFTKASFNALIEEGNKRNAPGVWMKLYQTVNPEKQTKARDTFWSGYFNSLDHPIEPGSGLCIWIDDENIPENYKKAEYMAFVFPKDSSRYSYFDENGKVTKTTEQLTREKPGRFAYENVADYDPGSGCFSVPVTSDFSGEEIFGSAIVGNPFMCHLNFSKFQEANSEKIEAVYRIWGGDSFDESILYGDQNYPLEADNRNYIAPMQAFVVIKKEEYKNLRLENLRFSPDMGEIKPGAGLRSASLKDDIKTNTKRLSEAMISIVAGAKRIEIQSQEGDPVKAVYCYNLQGQTILSETNIADSKYAIDTAALPSFVIVKVITEKNVETKKLSF